MEAIATVLNSLSRLANKIRMIKKMITRRSTVNVALLIFGVGHPSVQANSSKTLLQPARELCQTRKRKSSLRSRYSNNNRTEF